jgi:transposase
MDYHLPDWLPIYFDKIYLVCGYTDLRKQINGLLEIVTTQYGIRASRGQLFLFCGGRCDRIKLLLYDGQSYNLIYHRNEDIRYTWPRKNEEIWILSREELSVLLEGKRLKENNTRQIISSLV